MTQAQELGRFAEDRAAEYLISLGWKILARNIRNTYGELDIAAADVVARPEELVIVEVRARTVGKVQGPLESVGSRKLRALVRASREFIESIGWAGFWRIDVVGVTFRDNKAPTEWELEHIRDITESMNVLC